MVSVIQDRNLIKEVEFIEKARSIHGDLYDYSKVRYISDRQKVIIIDPEYGEFEQIPYNHLMGANSPKRSYLLRCKKRVKTTEEFIEKSKEIHGDLYDYSKVVYVRSRIKVIIIDPIYGEFLQFPSAHLAGSGNPRRKFTYSNMEVDHIIPLSLLCKSKERNDVRKKCDLFKLLDSESNKRIVNRGANREKSDNIILFGENIKGRNYRKDFELIRYLVLRDLNINLCDYEIYDIWGGKDDWRNKL